MNLIEFIKHPAYNYYITTLVHIRDYNKYRNDNK